jgi:hypothetical protein
MFSAVVTAIVLYQLLETGLEFAPFDVALFALCGATLVALPVGVSYLRGNERQKKK